MVSVEKLDELIKGGPQWHLRSVNQVLMEEDWGDGSYPLHRDVSKVGDLLRIGADGLSIRFREVDPEIWKWLIEQLEELGGNAVSRTQAGAAA